MTIYNHYGGPDLNVSSWDDGQVRPRKGITLTITLININRGHSESDIAL